MQFKTNHSPWPFEIHHEDGDWLVLDSNGRIIAETWGADGEDMNEANRNLLAMAPAMLNYMMDRAKELHDFIYDGVLSIGNARRIYKEEFEELQRILAILKDAGVEVVE